MVDMDEKDVNGNIDHEINNLKKNNTMILIKLTI